MSGAKLNLLAIEVLELLLQNASALGPCPPRRCSASSFYQEAKHASRIKPSVSTQNKTFFLEVKYAAQPEKKLPNPPSPQSLATKRETRVSLEERKRGRRGVCDSCQANVRLRSIW